MPLEYEYNPIWLEIKKFLSIRSATTPRAFKRSYRIIYLSDITGVPIPWMKEAYRNEPLIPLEQRVGEISISENGLIAFGNDLDGNERWRISIYDLNQKNLIHVAGDYTYINNVGAWSIDSTKLGFTSNRRNGIDFDVYIYNIKGEVIGPIIEMEGTNNIAEWINDENMLIIHNNTNLDSDIYLLNTKSGKLKNLTKHEGEARNISPKVLDEGRFLFLTNNDSEYMGIAIYDLGKNDWKFIYQTNRDVELIELSPNKDKVAYVENVDGYSKLYIAKIDFTYIREMKTPSGVIGELSWGMMGLAYSISNPKIGNEIWIWHEGTGQTQMTNSPKFDIDMNKNVKPEVIRYESWDGMMIPALIYRPKNGKPPYPAVVTIHGGPEGQDRPTFQFLPQILVRLGYIVLSPNFRGSSGYGKSFIHLDDREKRLDSLKDIGALVDWAEKEGLLEKGRVAVTGASYGGYATLMSMALFPDYWSCGVERVGIVNLVTFIRNTGPWRRKYRINEYGDPDKMYDIMIKLSPISHIEKIKAPLMVIHGANDPRVPISEAEQLVEAMKKMGREVKYIRIVDEGHGIAKIINRVNTQFEIIKFIMEHTPIEKS
ncbi:MAG: S9 family peptidase [Candidatus Methanomethylicia archaeon]